MTGRTTVGTGTLLRFALRRERRGLPLWVLGAGLLILVQSTQSQNLYGSPEALAKLRQSIGGNTAVIAMNGPPRLLDTIGGEVVFEIFAFVAILVALMNMFLVGRHTRTDEETGRSELIRSARVGRHAPVAAALCLAGLANLAVTLVVFAAAAGTGLPAGGSALMGLAVGGVGLTFAALTAAAAQVFENGRAVYGTVAVILGASYVLRAAGDAGDSGLSWVSPIGWGQRTFPYTGDRWWPLLLMAGTVVVFLTVAVALLDRRDFGAGLVRPRLGRASGSAALGTPIGLAWRLQRGSLIGWAVGLATLGVAYGSIGDSIEQYIADNPQVADYLPGGAADVVNSYLALTLMLTVLIASAYGVTSAMRVRGEETSGRAEPVLATATSRGAWLASHLSVALLGSALVVASIGFGEGLAYGLTVSDAGQIPRLMAAALVYLPAVWLIVAATVLSIGWLPRLAAAIAWTLVGYCAVVALFAESFDLPGWSQSASPFTHTPQAPFEAVAAAPLAILCAITAGLVAAGLVGLRRRDLGY